MSPRLPLAVARGVPASEATKASHAQTKRTTLMALADAYIKSLAGEKRAPRYVRGVGDRLALAFQVMGARVVQDVTVQKIESFLIKLLTGDGMPLMKPRKQGCKPIQRGAVSTTTRDRYAEALRAFGAWLLATDRWATNPFAQLRSIAGDDDRTMEHRAWTSDEIGRLVEAAQTRCVQQWARTHPRSKPEALTVKLEALRAAGWRRAVLYEFAAYTGLRLNECATLTWEDVVLDGAEPCVTVKAKNSKNRKRGQSVPLVPWVVAALAELKERDKIVAMRVDELMAAQSDRVFTIHRGLLEALRKDARWAFGEKLGLHDTQGRRTTFHGFRASTCTMLHRAGVAIAVAVRVMRHADPKLTIETYAKLDALTDGHRELRKMAVPRVTAVPLGVAAGATLRPKVAVGDNPDGLGQPRGLDFRAVIAARAESEGISIEGALWDVFQSLLLQARLGDVQAARLLLDHLCDKEPVELHVSHPKDSLFGLSEQALDLPLDSLDAAGHGRVTAQSLGCRNVADRLALWERED